MHFDPEDGQQEEVQLLRRELFCNARTCSEMLEKDGQCG